MISSNTIQVESASPQTRTRVLWCLCPRSRSVSTAPGTTAPPACLPLSLVLVLLPQGALQTRSLGGTAQKDTFKKKKHTAKGWQGQAWFDATLQILGHTGTSEVHSYKHCSILTFHPGTQRDIAKGTFSGLYGLAVNMIKNFAGN